MTVPVPGTQLSIKLLVLYHMSDVCLIHSSMIVLQYWYNFSGSRTKFGHTERPFVRRLLQMHLSIEGIG